MELVNKLAFKNIINLKSISDSNKKLEKILKKKFKFKYFYSDYKKILNDKHKFIMIDGSELEYNSNFKKQTSELSAKLLSSFKNYLNIKKIEFNTSEFESLDALNLAKIICVISPLDHLTKQMLLEFNGSDELCENLMSVLEIEINNYGKSIKIN